MLRSRNTTGRPKGSGLGFPTRVSLPIEERRQSFIKKTRIGKHGCLEWTGLLNNKGYGVFAFNSSSCLAHRFSWIASIGEIPRGLCVLHRCDNRECVNPLHLFLGSKGDNNRDMFKKGRGSNPPIRSKITPSMVLKIRGLWIPYKVSFRSIAERLGITIKCVESAIYKWKGITNATK